MTDNKGRLEAVVHLRSVGLFKSLNAKELAPVADISTKAAFARGEVIVEQGDEGQHMFILTRGKIEVIKDGTAIATLGVGDCFGEMAVLDQTTRSATVRAVESDTRLLKISREDFQELLELYPSVARGIALTLAARVRHAVDG